MDRRSRDLEPAMREVFCQAIDRLNRYHPGLTEKRWRPRAAGVGVEAPTGSLKLIIAAVGKRGGETNGKQPRFIGVLGTDVLRTRHPRVGGLEGRRCSG